MYLGDKKYVIAVWNKKVPIVPPERTLKSQTRWYCWNLHLLESRVIFLSPSTMTAL